MIPLAPADLFPFEPLSIGGRRVDGVVSWNVNDTCNYRCSYCTQRFMPVRSYRLEEFEAYLSAFARLPGRWEIKLSGGEPFQQPELVKLVAGLIERGHLVSIQTNFSASDAKIEAFMEATRGSLHVFSASLHLEYDSVTAFIARHARVIAPYLEDESPLTFNVTSVATPARLAELRDEVAPRFRDAGITFKVQPEKTRGRLRDYSPHQTRIVQGLGGHNHTGVVANDFQGRLCHAGSRYLVVRSDGNVYRCYASRRHGGRFSHLGSFLEGFELLQGPHLCPYTFCYCTVPIHRGMIQGVPRTLG